MKRPREQTPATRNDVTASCSWRNAVTVATAAAAASNLVRRNGSSSRTLTCRRVRYTRPFVIRMRLSTAMHPRALRCCGISNAGAITIARSTGVTSIQDRSLGDRNFRRGDRSAAVDISCAVRVSSAAAPAGTILIVGGSPVSAYADGTFITLSPSVILDSKRRPGTTSPLRLIALTQEIAGAGQLRSQLSLTICETLAAKLAHARRCAADIRFLWAECSASTRMLYTRAPIRWGQHAEQDGRSPTRK